MKILKKVTHNQHFIERTSKILGTFLTIWLKSCEYKIINQHIIDDFEKSGKSALVTSWHCGLLPVLYFFRGHKSVVMVSQSKDGEWIEKVVNRWGYLTVRGSSGRGGLKAAREIIRYLQKGYNGGLIADGSRGPARIAQKGVIFLALKTGTPLIPIGVSAKPAAILPTWDRMIIPYPFSQIVLNIGHPIYLSRQKNIEESIKKFTILLNHLFKEADLMARMK